MFLGLDKFAGAADVIQVQCGAAKEAQSETAGLRNTITHLESKVADANRSVATKTMSLIEAEKAKGRLEQQLKSMETAHDTEQTAWSAERTQLQDECESWQRKHASVSSLLISLEDSLKHAQRQSESLSLQMQECHTELSASKRALQDSQRQHDADKRTLQRECTELRQECDKLKVDLLVCDISENCFCLMLIWSVAE